MRTFLEYIENVEKAATIKTLIDQNELVMFFRYNSDFFGAPEESRVVFARMKNPSSDNPLAWRKEAGFTALNLSKLIKEGEKKEQMFEFKDLKSIKIVEKDDIVAKLEKGPVKYNTPTVDIEPDDKEIPANMGGIDEK